MAKILDFQCPPKAEQVVDECAPEPTTAEIIIFPGVRIERYEDDPFEAAAAREKRRR